MAIGMGAAGNMNAALGMGGTSGMGGWMGGTQGAFGRGGAFDPSVQQGNMQQANSVLNRYQTGSFGGGAGGGGFGFGGNSGFDVNAVMQKNIDEKNKTDSLNTGRWQTGVDMLNQAQAGYFNDPTHQATQGLVGNILANPDVLSKGVQAQIQGNAANMVNANAAAQGRQQAGIMAAGGQTDAGSLAAMQNQVSRQGIGQLGQVQSNLDIQAALQNRASNLAAIQAGQAQSGQNFGVTSHTADSYLNNVLYQRPMDMSGYLAQGQMGGGGMPGGGGAGFGGGAPQPSAQWGGPGAGFGAPKRMDLKGGFGSSNSYYMGGDGYANAAGGGPGAATPGASYGGGNGMMQPSWSAPGQSKWNYVNGVSLGDGSNGGGYTGNF